jgi:hypothetical protein
VIKHRDTDSLPFCLFLDNDGDKSMKNLYIKLKERFEGDVTVLNAIIMTSYKLKEGVSVPDFILAADKFHEVFVSKQKGVICCKLLEGDDGMWADYSV